MSDHTRAESARATTAPPAFGALEAAPYVSLATFRRSGERIATPVWCAPDGVDFYFFSAGDAGKGKRLRNSDRAALATCDFRGGLSSGWVDASAVLLEDDRDIARALRALRRKYGWQMWMADTGAKLTGRYYRRAYIRARLIRS
jgi:PPOX class probable F420-dependent enzyme